jgi:putative phage-type endonuclease
MSAVNVALRQGSPEWLAYRRTGISASDIPVLLGLSPYKCEADLADEKLSGTEQPQSIPMKVGLALEDVIAGEYEAVTGRRLQRFRSILRHPDIEWAIASPDRRVIGEQRVVELKHTGSSSRFADGLPQDVEAQVAWQLGVLGWDVADVAVLVGGRELLPPFTVEADPTLFANLVTVAEDFRRRLAEGGPFARDTARIKRDYPADDGSEMLADADLAAAVKALVDTRAARKRLEASETAIEDAIKARMGEAARLVGDGFSVTWKRTKDREETDWRSLAAGLLRQLPEPERTALVGIHSTVREGFRPFRVTLAKEDPE